MKFNQIYFQQDSAPSHFILQAQNFYEVTFSERVIVRSHYFEWLSCTCNLTSMDFFLRAVRGYIRNQVYNKKCNALDQLLGQTRRAMRLIIEALCFRTNKSVGRSLAECCDSA